MTPGRPKRKGDKLKIGFLMDPIENINLETDTTFVIMLEAQRRKHEICCFTPPDVWVEDGKPKASISSAKVRWPSSSRSTHYTLQPPKDTFLEKLDIVFNRVDPPYSIEYVTALQVLGLVPAPTVVVNRPRGVLLANEKILAMHFHEFMPPTMVTADKEKLMNFLKKCGGKMILKPLEGFGGEGVLLVEKDHTNTGSIIQSMTGGGRKPVVAQKYLPVEKDGDKRIILLAGEPVGAVLRMPPKGDIRANLHSGGKAVKTTITARDREICDAVGPFLRREGLYIAGLDIIAGKLTELNVTSPTLVQQINQFDGVRVEERIMDFCEYLSESARNSASR